VAGPALQPDEGLVQPLQSVGDAGDAAGDQSADREGTLAAAAQRPRARLAPAPCQVQAQGDVVVHTRVGGPEVAGNTDWPDTDEPTKWKERWEKRHEGKGGAAEPDEEAEAEG
jgi:hypothetical protein